MKTIFSRTLKSMFKPILIIIYFVLFIGLITLISFVAKYSSDVTTLIEVQKTKVIETFVTLNFIWSSGILLNIFILGFGSGIFAAEEAEGTMRILLAKPNSREAMILGKILGLLIGSLIYMASSLIISITIYSLITSIDVDVLKSLIQFTPVLLLYGIFIIFFFAGLTSMLSSFFKKRVPAIIILIICVLFTYGIIPIGRTVLTAFGKYESYHLYWVDTNYHIGSIYLNTLKLNDEFELTSSGKEVLSIFAGIYKYEPEDQDIKMPMVYYPAMKENDLLNKNIITVTYISLATAFYIICYIRMKNKDIS